MAKYEKPGRWDHRVQDSRRRALVKFALLAVGVIVAFWFGPTALLEWEWTPGGYVAQLAATGCVVQDWEGVDVSQSAEHKGVRVRRGPVDAVIHVPAPYVYIQNPTPADIESARSPGMCGA